MKFHPDKNKASDAEEKFREIAEAYEVLSKARTRKDYDQFGTTSGQNTGQAPTGGGAGFNFNFDDFFNDFDSFFTGGKKGKEGNVVQKINKKNRNFD